MRRKGRCAVASLLCIYAMAACETSYSPVRRPITAQELAGRWIPFRVDTAVSALRSLVTEKPPPAKLSLDLRVDLTCEAGPAFVEFLAACNRKAKRERNAPACAWALGEQPLGREVTLVVSSSVDDHLAARLLVQLDPSDGELVLGGLCGDGEEYLLVRPRKGP